VIGASFGVCVGAGNYARTGTDDTDYIEGVHHGGNIKAE